MSLRWALCFLLVASVTFRSKGLDIIASSPDLHLGPPPEAAHSPAQLAKPVINLLPSPASSPKAEAAPPSIFPAIPLPILPSPSNNFSMRNKWPGNISPSIDAEPNGPSISANEPAPYYATPPTKSYFHEKTDPTGSPITSTHAPAVARSSPPTLPHTKVTAPPVAPAPNAVGSHGEYGPALPPMSIGSSTSHGKSYGAPITARAPRDASSSPMLSPPREAMKHPVVGHAPAQPPSVSPSMPLHPPAPPTKVLSGGPKSSPITSKHQRRAKKRVKGPALAQSVAPAPPPSHSAGLVGFPGVSPAPGGVSKFRQQHHAHPPIGQDPSLPIIQAPAPSPLSTFPSGPKEWSSHSPTTSSTYLSGKPKAASPPTVWSLPPPPPNLDCKFLECSEPLTNPPPGSPCVCVWPIKVGVRLHSTIYSFFPLVSEFAQEIASGMAMKQSQVRIMGANAAREQPEDTTVLVHLVPLAEKFDYVTAFSAYDKFWNKQILIKPELFGDYDVRYVLFPGLPPSPPAAPLNVNLGDGSYGNRNNSRTIKPLGVDVRKRKEKMSTSSIIAIAVLLSFTVFTICIVAAGILILRNRDHSRLSTIAARRMLPMFAKSSETRHILLTNRPSSVSTSVSSGLASYNGSAKTFTIAEIERATDNFADSRIIGEGGFGLVYRGALEDGIQVAVKVLKRDDLQGGREFLAEVEMLSRLHHRNLVKLIGICIEDGARCLVYELIPNGSVESHLHGKDKETCPLDWNARLKIALGAARGLAYLHEDSSPRVIHRDFKSSNILLEHDYTPRVSDFGLARAALDEGSGHISTRVMGTFGYVAPEYAMTGHLLVKSDVYSYGVVLLELLTGRKPVDMSRPPGQENLVSWARPLLTSADGSETIIDPALRDNVASDNIAKVAALASMCVQPEVSHRPFMGEVVQALKLVCNESDEDRGSGGCSQGQELTRINLLSTLEAERALLASDVFGTSPEYVTEDFRLFQRHSSSGPFWAAGRRKNNWQTLRSLSTGSMSDHNIALTSGD